MSALLLVVLLILVLINGLFVAAEFALVRARRSRLEAMARDGVRGIEPAINELNSLDEYLSACQVGITMASIGIGFLGEPALAHLLEPAFGGLSHGVAVAISVVIAYVLVTSIHITVGEQVPKMLAITRAEGTLRALARPLDVFRAVSGPFTIALTKLANAISRLFGVSPERLGAGAHRGGRQGDHPPVRDRWRPRPRGGRRCWAGSSTCTSRRPAR